MCFILLAQYIIQINQQKSELRSLRASLNITPNCQQDILIFNRVPKVGSQTINQLIGELRARNNFTGFTSLEGMPENLNGGETIRLPRKEMRELAVKTLATIPERPVAFLKHQHFFNFSEFGYKSPIYMNFVRDPVERIISWYYYVRAPWYLVSIQISLLLH